MIRIMSDGGYCEGSCKNATVGSNSLGTVHGLRSREKKDGLAGVAVPVRYHNRNRTRAILARWPNKKDAFFGRSGFFHSAPQA